jgi:hypothetical protein
MSRIDRPKLYARRNDQACRGCKECGGHVGPYEIKKAAFDLAVQRKRLLDGGTIKYRADDRLYRKDKVAISCFHAMAGLDELFPTADFSGRDLRCGASMERQEC